MRIPKNEVAEKNLIGKLLLQGESIDNKLPKVMEVIGYADFTSKWGLVYKKMVELYKKGKHVDTGTLAMVGVELKEISEAVNEMVTSADIMEVAQCVKTASMLRYRMTLASRVLQMCENEDDIEKIDSELVSVKNEYIRSADDVIADYEKYEKEHMEGAKKGLLGFATQIPELDVMTFGLQRGHVWSVGGYRGSGKSYFGLHIANEVLLQKGSVLCLNLEMSNDEFIQRMVALNTMSGTLEVLGENFSKDDFKSDMRKGILQNIKTNKLILKDGLHDGINTIDRIESTIMAECTKHKIDVVILDFIQLIHGDDMYKKISDAVVRLQRLAQRYGITMVILSQLNNDVVKAGQNSTVDGFKGAGEISQVANVAIKIIRELGTDGKLTEMFKLEVVKVRHNFGGDIYTKIEFPGGKIGGKYKYVAPKNKKDEMLDNLDNLIK